ncbi:MAG: DUF1156 domain-containing protein [Acidobacteria bacterium]|nr:DUF1156 domain-containing protein [Acidobacteriota bacterium]
MSDRRSSEQDATSAGPETRLIEAAFPLRQASLDSVHEKNVRHGHISTLHIWPARRPLAACRAVLLATLLPDPGDVEGRRRLMARIGGEVRRRQTRAGKLREETAGGVLHWGRESDPELEKLRDEIREAFGGRAPRVLDPFAGGGAIPLEAMRLGCEVTASDLNPVAWFVLRCTLHYPRLVAGQELPLPGFAVRDRVFVEACLKARGVTRKAALREELRRLGHSDGDPVQARSALLDSSAEPRASTGGEWAGPALQVGFPWHLRAWGRWVLAEARRDLANRYPTYADFEPVRRKGRGKRDSEIRFPEQRFRPRQPRLLEPDAGGNVSVAELNAEFDAAYLENEANPRWVAKPTVAYLWARTIRCANCRAEIPLLKTRWLCKKSGKRVLLSMTPREDGSGVEFAVEHDVPEGDGNAARRREHDRRLGAGTMSRSGAACPCCDAISTMADLRNEGRAGRLGERMTAVVVDGQQGKEYRLPTDVEVAAASVGEEELRALFAEIPFGLPEEPTPKGGSGAARAFSVDGYGFGTWRELFTNRQLLALGALVRAIRGSTTETNPYPEEWREALSASLSCILSKLADYSSGVCSWHNSKEQMRATFARFALPMVWDNCEVNPLSGTSGGFAAMADWVARYADHGVRAVQPASAPVLRAKSAIEPLDGGVDVICTDPPYYDAIPYSDLMDFFYVWLRRALHGLSSELDVGFAAPLGPKWSKEASGGKGDGELIDDASRFGGDRDASKRNYEDGMARAFGRFHDALRPDGRLVIVFANKQPDAWETLVSALIRAGFVACGSWPIQTEMKNRQRSLASAALSSSIWLVCRRRPAEARPGWDAAVLAEMRSNITESLRRFWDAGIRGPDFVWAATGPALEAFSRHPVVKKADSPSETLSVAEFLRQVRRIVVTFVVNRLLESEPGGPTELDDLTTYYLLHRNDFGLDAAPAGVCILYAVSCNLSDADLAGGLDLLARGAQAGVPEASDEDGDGEAPPPAPSGSEARLKPWNRRGSRGLGEPSPTGEPPALIDCVHRLMQLWRTGDQGRVDRYLADRGLWRHELFARVVQAVIELAAEGSEERSILESIQNHLQGSGAIVAGPSQRKLV